ncbi:Glycosyltransferase [Candidatus Desulfarcum epimagneticum]|uniref:Glycosyltransferase n=1 Tax=uncultured Desulfobacteraceae bacterium TaxID=218296 RepID=A0A484HLK4_9BACT|nr:Glycosyltransferase [uncultured Desulfobacteraceae bacterium]
MLIINAPNVHSGGGYTLLRGLLKALDNSITGFIFLDKRFYLDFSIPRSFTVHRVAPTLRGRLSGELKLKSLVNKKDLVFCFGNLPPLFRLKGKTCVYLQNRHLLESGMLKGFSPSTRLKITLERRWLSWREKNVDIFLVQTPSMQRIMKNNFGNESKIIPFHTDVTNYQRFFKKSNQLENKKWDFIYVASGDPHKNHHRLIKAWIYLAEEGITPTLCLTIDKKKYHKLCAWIENIKKAYGLNIYNSGKKPYKSVIELYRNAGALIYPSLCETIGLPLIEARSEGLPILASELDYVRDVVEPEQSFDPVSEISMGRAVKRFLGAPMEKLDIKEPHSFIKEILKIS